MAVVHWLLTHIKEISIFSLIGMLFKVIRMVLNLKSRAEEVEKTQILIATNHLPHLQIELEKLNDSSIRTLAGIDKLNNGIQHTNTLLTAIVASRKLD